MREPRGKRLTKLAAPVALAIIAFGCSDTDGHNAPIAGPNLSVERRFRGIADFLLCKEGTDADFIVRVHGFVAGVPTTLPDQNVHLAAGECLVVQESRSEDKERWTVEVTELVAPGTMLDSIVKDSIFNTPTTYDSLRLPTILGTNVLQGVMGTIIGGGEKHINATFFNSTPCKECMGGVTQLTLRNNGPDGVVTVKAGKKVIFEEFVASGEHFTVIGQKKDGKLGKEIKVRVDGGSETKIHTSCSKPIGPGSTFGAFEVVSAISKDGGAVCPPGDDGDGGLCELGKPQVLVMLYTGEACSATMHSQDPGKVSCTDVAGLGSPVRILATDKENLDDNKAHLWFDDLVDMGSTFNIDATADGDNKLKANTWVHIFGTDGALQQLVQFHTSCSQPLGLGDQFGSLVVIDFVPEL